MIFSPWQLAAAAAQLPQADARALLGNDRNGPEAELGSPPANVATQLS